MSFLFLILFSVLAFADEEKLSNLRETIPTYLNTLASPAPVVTCEPGGVENFCKDPYRAICSDMRTHRNAQLARTESLSPGNGNAFVSTRREEAKNSFTKISQHMRNALRNSSLSASDKNDFDVLIQRTKMVTASEYKEELEKKRPMTKEDLTRIDSMERTCDYDNVKPLALAFQANEQGGRTNDPVVVVCDGLLDSLPPGRDLTDRLFMVVAHELSHVYSAHWYPGSYPNLGSCLMREEGDTLKREYMESARKHSFDDEVIPDPPLDRLVGAMMPEISCDFWAKEAYKDFLSEGVSREDTLTKLRESYGYFCGVETSGSHPSGRLRIELIGRDPAVRRHMGCQDSPSSPVKPLNCSL